MSLSRSALLSLCWVVPVIAGCAGPEAPVPSPHQGVLELEQTVMAFETGGRIVSLELERGQKVVAGQRIGALDDTLVAPARKARLAEIEAAKSQLALLESGARTEDISTLKAQIRALRANEQTLATALRRQRRLVDDRTAPEASLDELDGRLRGARAQREAAEHQLASAKSGARPQEIDAAKARVVALEATLELEDTRARKLVLNAPCNGTVLEVLVKPGEVVGAGTPVATLADPTRPFAEIFVPTSKLGPLAVGQPLVLLVDTLDEKHSSAIDGMTSLHARISRIAATPEFTPRFVFSREERAHLVTRVRVEVENPAQAAHPGMPVFAIFEGISARVAP